MRLGSAQDWIATITSVPTASLYLIQVMARIQAIKTTSFPPKTYNPKWKTKSNA